MFSDYGTSKSELQNRVEAIVGRSILEKFARFLGVHPAARVLLWVRHKETEGKAERNRTKNLKKTPAKDLWLKVSEKGAVSVYGFGRFPVTLYKEQWLKLLDIAEEIRAFINANDSHLKSKESAAGAKAGKDLGSSAELERLRSENWALKGALAKGLGLKAGEKGGVSVYGLRRFPVTLYKEQWLKLLDSAEEIRAFIQANDSHLKTRESVRSTSSHLKRDLNNRDQRVHFQP